MKHVERRTSWKVIVAYLFVIAFCGALFYYVYNLEQSILHQRINIEVQNMAIDETNKFTRLVHQAQSEANLFAMTENPKHLKIFGNLNNEISRCADTLLVLMPDKENEQRIREVERLILRKGQISYVLSRQFNYYDPFAEIDAKLQSSIENDSIRNDSVDVVSDLKILSEKARAEYRKRIKEYETKTAELIRDDNKISEEISELLLDLNREMVDQSVKEIEQNEKILEENLYYSTIIAGVILGLVVIFVILILSDVNKASRARKAAESARNEAEEARKKTEETMESRHKMLLQVTHDIKTPLTSIMGNVELMDHTGNEKEMLSIQQSTDHILSLLHNLLEFSSLEQGKLQVENSVFNVSQLCEETAAMFKPIARNKNLAFRFDNQLGGDLSVNSDRLKIKQIISNLISNAIKYTIEGGIDFQACFEEGQLVFRIQDSGVGIPENRLDDIFTPFVRIDNGSNMTEGSGYGLSVVKGLIDLMNGEIEVDSIVGKGSLFTVRIPTEVELFEQEPTLPTSSPPTEPETKAPQLKILIIDDDDTLLTVLSNMINKLGHQVLISRSKSDLDSALLQLEQFDCVLTDREMGALSGNDILKLFKDADAQKPVYLMTARTDYDMDKALAEGFNGFLQKPFNLKNLESLFGRHAKEEPTGDSCTFKDFPELCHIMDDDEEAIRNILTVFAQSTADHLVALNECIEHDDLPAAHSLCHKMLPMFKQLQQEEAIPFLSRMNLLRGKTSENSEYPEWKEDAVKFMDLADKLLETLSQRYEIG